MAPVTLHREINALGGTPSDEWSKGYNEAIGEVLDVLERRGFSEAEDACPLCRGEGFIRTNGWPFGPDCPRCSDGDTGNALREIIAAEINVGERYGTADRILKALSGTALTIVPVT